MPIDKFFFDALLPKEKEVLYSIPPSNPFGAVFERPYSFAQRCSRKISRLLKRKSTAFLRPLIQNLISSIQPALEIGPFNSPFLNTDTAKFFDVRSQNELYRAACSLGIEQKGIVPEIDYVSSHGDLSGIHEAFDLVFSSHSFEHQVDIVRHLQQVYNLLNKNGVYILAIPDYRYCFDYYKPETTIPDVLDAYYSHRKNHTLRDLLFAVMYDTHNNPGQHWLHNHGKNHVAPTDDNVERLKPYLEMWRNNEISDGYIDVHAWRFQPNSFRSILVFLQKMKLINFEILRIYNTNYNEHEFFAALIKR